MAVKVNKIDPDKRILVIGASLIILLTLILAYFWSASNPSMPIYKNPNYVKTHEASPLITTTPKQTNTSPVNGPEPESCKPRPNYTMVPPGTCETNQP